MAYVGQKKDAFMILVRGEGRKLDVRERIIFNRILMK